MISRPAFLAGVAASAILFGTLAPASAAPGTTSVNSGQTIVTDSSLAVQTMDGRLRQDAATGSTEGAASLQAWEGLTVTQREQVTTSAADEDFVQIVASGATDRATLDTVSPDLQVSVDKTNVVVPEGSAMSLTSAGGTQILPPDTGIVRYYYVTSTWTHVYKILGVTITSIKQTFEYQTNAKTVTRTYGCRASSMNYAPTRSLSGSTEHYAAGGKGYCKTVWRLYYAAAYIPTPFYRDFTQNLTVNGRQIEATYFS